MARRSVPGALAAVDLQDLAGNERRRLEVEHAADDVVDLANSPERVYGSQAGVGARVVHTAF